MDFVADDQSNHDDKDPLMGAGIVMVQSTNDSTKKKADVKPKKTYEHLKNKLGSWPPITPPYEYDYVKLSESEQVKIKGDDGALIDVDIIKYRAIRKNPVKRVYLNGNVKISAQEFDCLAIRYPNDQEFKLYENIKRFKQNNDSQVYVFESNEHTKTGNQLPGYERNKKFNADANSNKIYGKKVFAQTKFYTNLPPLFYQELIEAQSKTKDDKVSENHISFPLMGGNKAGTVLSYMTLNSKYKQGTHPLHLSKWKELGWQSEAAYKDWLNQPMLFAFSHCNHYCSAVRIVDIDPKKTNKQMAVFKYLSTDEVYSDKAKTTNIYTVTGYEYRGYEIPDGKGGYKKIQQNDPEWKKMIDGVNTHTQKTIEDMLAVANEQHVTDIILIPFGMGVFLSGGINQEQANIIKKSYYQSIARALHEYKGPPISIHCSGIFAPLMAAFKELKLEMNNLIKLENAAGIDAYTLANALNDLGTEGKRNPRTQTPFKSMLINAGDTDWLALEAGKTPGQQFIYHDLFKHTSDEYFGLVTNFACHSFDSLRDVYGNDLVAAGKIQSHASQGLINIFKYEVERTRFYPLLSHEKKTSTLVNLLENIASMSNKQDKVIAIQSQLSKAKEQKQYTRSKTAQTFYESWSEPEKAYEARNEILNKVDDIINRKWKSSNIFAGRHIRFEFEGEMISVKVSASDAKIIKLYQDARDYKITWQEASKKIKVILEQKPVPKPVVIEKAHESVPKPVVTQKVNESVQHPVVTEKAHESVPKPVVTKKVKESVQQPILEEEAKSEHKKKVTWDDKQPEKSWRYDLITSIMENYREFKTPDASIYPVVSRLIYELTLNHENKASNSDTKIAPDDESLKKMLSKLKLDDLRLLWLSYQKTMNAIESAAVNQDLSKNKVPRELQTFVEKHIGDATILKPTLVDLYQKAIKECCEKVPSSNLFSQSRKNEHVPKYLTHLQKLLENIPDTLKNEILNDETKKCLPELFQLKFNSPDEDTKLASTSAAPKLG